jgi:CSLREA domain-containing protein
LFRSAALTAAAAALVAGLLVAVPAPAAAAQTFTVTRTDDPAPNGCAPADCSLREAVIAANADAVEDTIVVPTLGGDYALTLTGTDDTAALGDLDITNPLLIQGAQVVIKATGLNDRLFHVLPGVTATVSNITMVDGRPAGPGGGIYNAGTLTLDHVRLVNNIAGRTSLFATSGGNGGAVYNSGTLLMYSTELSNNNAGNGATPFFCFVDCNGGNGGSGGNGGNLYNDTSGSVVATGSVIQGGAVGNGGAGEDGSCFVTPRTGGSGGNGGRGGGIYNNGGSVTLIETVVRGNSANGTAGAGGSGCLGGAHGAPGSPSRGGGGIYNAGGNLFISEGSTVGNPNSTTGNGGGIYHEAGTLVVEDSTIGPNTSGGPGAGIYSIATTILTRSTIRDNTTGAWGGGIRIEPGGTLVGTNLTVSGNSSANDGAGIDSSGDVTLTQSTVTNNTSADAAGPGGLWLNTSTDANLTGTIIAGNTSAGANPDCRKGVGLGSIGGGGFNIFGTAAPAGCNFIMAATDILTDSPGLGLLAANSSPHTHAVLAGSVALDKIPPASCGAGTDARGVSRPQGPGCEIGAYELAVGDTVGLVDVAAGKWYLRNSQGVVTSFFYGNPVDLPISGDWDGDGDATPGLYRQSDGFFYARNSNSQGVADNSCFAGDPSDIPLSGDWDGDGDDNLGIYRPSEQKFYLFTITCTGTPMGAAQIVLAFGNPGDKPVAGDWDGDGVDEIGLHRESTGFFYWRNTLDTGIASGEIFFGDPNDRFVAGEFGVVDGVDTPGIFRPSNLTFYFRHTLTQGVADSQFVWAGAGLGWLPVAGNFQLG